jgi:hypothetical protein
MEKVSDNFCYLEGGENSLNCLPPEREQKQLKPIGNYLKGAANCLRSKR